MLNQCVFLPPPSYFPPYAPYRCPLFCTHSAVLTTSVPPCPLGKVLSPSLLNASALPWHWVFHSTHIPGQVVDRRYCCGWYAQDQLVCHYVLPSTSLSPIYMYPWRYYYICLVYLPGFSIIISWDAATSSLHKVLCVIPLGPWIWAQWYMAHIFLTYIWVWTELPLNKNTRYFHIYSLPPVFFWRIPGTSYPFLGLNIVVFSHCLTCTAIYPDNWTFLIPPKYHVLPKIQFPINYQYDPYHAFFYSSELSERIYFSKGGFFYP